MQGKTLDTCSPSNIVADVGPTNDQVHILKPQIVQCNVHARCWGPGHMHYSLLYFCHLEVCPVFSKPCNRHI